jgi:hypothetical protein
VVKLWWIAGGSWWVMVRIRGSKNMPLFPDLFLRDSHFGNSVLKTARKIGKVTGINLVDEISELNVTSQFGKVIRIDTKPIRAAGRCTPGVTLLNHRSRRQGALAFHGNSLSFSRDLRYR